MEFIYRARLKRDDGGYIVTFPDVPEAITHGRDLDDAKDNAADALTVALLGRMKDGGEIPAAKAKSKGLAPIALPAQAAAKLALYMAWRESGLTRSALARAIGKDEAEVRRMLDPYHQTKLPALEGALAALGQKLVVTVEAA